MSKEDLKQDPSDSSDENDIAIEEESEASDSAPQDAIGAFKNDESDETKIAEKSEDLIPSEEEQENDGEDLEDSEESADEELSNSESFESTEPEENIDNYFEDDENWGKAEDSIVFTDEESVVVQQDEAIVKWDIEGLYSEDTGKVRSKRSLKNNPPVLKISNSFGEEVSFVLTKDLSKVLARHFENTHRAYYGIKPRDEMSFREKSAEFGSTIKANMGKAILVGTVLVAILVFGLIF